MLFYKLLIRLYVGCIRLAALFYSKPKNWVEGRRNWQERFRKSMQTIDKNRIWIHCASLGEFEQGRPIIEAISKNLTEYKIVLTFFSPSGYLIRKNYPNAHFIDYLPADKGHSASNFFDIVQPTMVILVKYEFWPGYLHEANVRQIPVISISSIFRANQIYFKPYGRFFLHALQTIHHFFVQNTTSEELLKKQGIHQVTVCGDTRMDRVYQLSQNPDPIPYALQFAKGNKILIAGSTWSADDLILSSYILHNMPQGWKAIIAPHEISDRNTSVMTQLLGPAGIIKYSEMQNGKKLRAEKVLLIDNVGMLASLYQYGTVAYIGGGFGKGIHNIAEAAVFGLPVFFGPKYHKFQEAIDLIELNAAQSIQNYADFSAAMERLLSAPNALFERSQTARKYIESNKGATHTIMQYVEKALKNE